MRRLLWRLQLLGLLTIFGAGACVRAPTPVAGAIDTAVAQAAFDLLTQTAAASSPTPTPRKETATPSPTETASVEPTGTKVKRPQILRFTSCWFGPGPSYVLDSNISEGEYVVLRGIGSVPGWYVIKNPYFRSSCWVQAADLYVDPGTDLTQLPVFPSP